MNEFYNHIIENEHSKERDAAFYMNRYNFIVALSTNQGAPDPVAFLKQLDSLLDSWPLTDHQPITYNYNESWDTGLYHRIKNIDDQEFVDRIIDGLIKKCLSKIGYLRYNQLVLSSNCIEEKETLDESKIDSEEKDWVIISTCTKVSEEYFRECLYKIYECYKNLNEDHPGSTINLLYGFRNRGDELKRDENDGANSFFWKYNNNKEVKTENTNTIQFPNLEMITEDTEGNPLTGTLGIDNRTLLSLLLITNKILVSLESFRQDEKNRLAKIDRKERRQKVREASDGNNSADLRFRVLDNNESWNLVGGVSDIIKDWHEFKPDYVFLTETTGFSAGYIFKEAWRVAYPNEKPPIFYRVDPVAMGRNSNANSIEGYSEKLKAYLDKRIHKPNAKIAVFDEQSVSGNSLRTVGYGLAGALGLPYENIRMTNGGYAFYKNPFFASGSKEKLTNKLTSSTVDTPIKYENADKIKFTGNINSIKGYTGYYDENNKPIMYNRLELINDFKTLGYLAGRSIKNEESRKKKDL